MAQKDRKYGQHIAAIYIGASEFTGILSNVEVAVENETFEARCLEDRFRHPVSFLGGWRLEGETVRRAGLFNLLRQLAAEKLATWIIATVWEESDPDNYETYSGYVAVESLSHVIPEGAQTHRFRLIGRTTLNQEFGRP